MKVTSFLALLLSATSALATERYGCHGDNCANQVTGTFGGIGVPVESRVAMCNSYLRTTVKPAPTTTTRVITKYTTRIPKTTGDSYGKASGNAVKSTKTITITKETIIPSSVPTFAAEKCSSKGDFSSACACWANVTASTTTLRRSTATATTTTYLNVGCKPAATAVAKADQFYCSRQLGMCSCLRSDDHGDVCVKIGNRGSGDGYGTGPCEKSKECNAKGECDEPGTMCVYDGSCKCGKRRCYKAAPRGCEYQGLPMDESKKM